MLTGRGDALVFLGLSEGGIAAVHFGVDVLTNGLAFVGFFFLFLVDVLVLFVRHQIKCVYNMSKVLLFRLGKGYAIGGLGEN